MCTVNPEKNMTLEQWLTYWFDTYAKRSIKQSTAISYIGYINNHIVPNIGSYPISELTADILQDFFITNIIMEILKAESNCPLKTFTKCPL